MADVDKTMANFPQVLDIGGLKISPPTVLAPMEGLTDAPFRAMVREIGGCGLVVTELVSARELACRTRRALRASAIGSDARPVAIQIYGRDPETMAESARICQELGPDVVDINMGCPSRAVTRRGAGAALMRDLERATGIVRAVRQVVEVPLTVKMRLGWDGSSITAPELARRCEGEGVQAIAVHGRTREEMFGGRAHWDRIGEVKAAVTIPVIGNGDVRSAADAREIFRVSGVDGVMIGRAAIRNPWIFLQVAQVLKGQPLFQPTLRQRQGQLLEQYARVLAGFDRPRAATGHMKKIIGHYTDGVPKIAELRQRVFHAETPEEVIEEVNTFFDRAVMEDEGAG